MSEFTELEQGQVYEGQVVLFEIDLTTFGEGTFYVVQGAADEAGTAVAFGGQAYAPHPVELSGIDRTVDGPFPRPTLKISNIGALFTSLLEQHDDLKGGIVRRIVTYKKFLDGEAAADDTAHRPVETYVIKRKSAHSTLTEVVEFELAAAIDQDSADLPRGTCLRDFCPLIYRTWNGSSFDYDDTDEACPYAEATYFDENDVATADPAEDSCSKLLSGCEARYGTDQLPFGGFPGMTRVRIG